MLLILLLNFSFEKSFSKELLFDKQIDFNSKQENSLDEFPKEYADNIDIEKFIRKEIESEHVVVSLDECIDIALRNNFNIAIAQKEYFSSKYEYLNALSKFLPILTTRSYVSDLRGQILVGGVLSDKFHETVISSNLTLEHELLQGGKQFFEAKAKKYFSRSRKHELNFTRTQVLYYVSKYYYEMLLAKVSIEIYLKNYIERNIQLELAKKLSKTNNAKHFNIARSQNEVSQARINLIFSLNKFRLSQSKLANLMGIKVDTPLMPFENKIIPIKLVDESLKIIDYFAFAQNKREDLSVFKDVISYEKQVKNMLFTDFLPKPRITFQGQYQGTIATSVKPNYILTGLIDWMPGENIIFGTLTNIKAQKENIKKKVLEYENKLRLIYQDIIDSYSNTFFTKKQIDVAKKRIEYTNEVIKLAVSRFNKSDGFFSDIIDAQNEVTLACIEYVELVMKYNLSQIELLYNSGLIDVEILAKNYIP